MTNVLDASIAQIRALSNDNHDKTRTRPARVLSRIAAQERDSDALSGAVRGDLGQMLALELNAAFDPEASREFERIAGRALSSRGGGVVRSLVKVAASIANHVRDNELDYERPGTSHSAHSMRMGGASVASF